MFLGLFSCFFSSGLWKSWVTGPVGATMEATLYATQLFPESCDANLPGHTAKIDLDIGKHVFYSGVWESCVIISVGAVMTVDIQIK